MKKILSIVLCIVLCFVLFSCGEQGKKIETDASDIPVINNNDPYTFENIADLLTAIKKNLDQYENMQVSVKGFVLEIDEHITLTDVPGDGGVKHRHDANNSAKITIIMINEKKMTVLDEGDHVRISGTVKISDTEIYLDSCDYEMIKSIYE